MDENISASKYIYIAEKEIVRARKKPSMKHLMDVEGVVHQAFVKALRTFSGEGDIRGYLRYKIRHALLDEARKQDVCSRKMRELIARLHEISLRAGMPVTDPRVISLACISIAEYMEALFAEQNRTCISLHDKTGRVLEDCIKTEPVWIDDQDTYEKIYRKAGLSKEERFALHAYTVAGMSVEYVCRVLSRPAGAVYGMLFNARCKIRRTFTKEELTCLLLPENI